MSRKVKIFIGNKNDINDATSVYIENIKLAFNQNNYEVSIVDKVSSLLDAKFIVTVDAKCTTMIKLLLPFKNVITWYQGIVPEEAKMVFNSQIRYLYWSFFEFFALKFSFLNIFVSDSMVRHYEDKYRLDILKKFVMPCFNKLNNIKMIHSEKKPFSFVYAGSSHKWQCIEEMLIIFKYIKKLESRSSLSIFCSDFKFINQLLEKHEIKDVHLDYVPAQQLDDKLKTFEYGFLIRDNNVVNNVATPTKLNSYYSLNIKPIVSNCIHDFLLVLNDENSIILDVDDSLEEMAGVIYNKLLKYDFDDFHNESKLIFDTYYNINEYNKDLTIVIAGL